jgi:(2Fe-2S) ferredoxin
MSKTVNPSNFCILLCQHCSCRKAGSSKVLQAFKELAPQEVSIVACGCLGHCGSGPNALVLPEEIWYDHVQPITVADIIQRHYTTHN